MTITAGWLRSPRAFAAEVQWPLKLIREVAAAVEKHYQSPVFRAKGLSGAVRRIDRPSDRLKSLQRRISDLLGSQLRFGEFVHGSVKGGSPRTLAAHHRGQRVVVKIDIANFFPSITSQRIEGLLQERLGASRQIAKLVARLLTRSSAAGARTSFLPQGSPASPLIANLSLMQFDRTVSALAEEAGVRYDRYVDDIVLSGEGARELIPVVVGMLRREGFRPARTKLRVMPKGAAQVAVGLNLQRKLSPTREFRKGCEELLADLRRDPVSAEHVRARLAGKLSYAKLCEGSFSRRLEARSAPFLRSVPLKGED